MIEPGEVYGQLTVIREIAKDEQGRRRFLCRCSCGNEKTIRGQGLRPGSSCGCAARNLMQFYRRDEVDGHLIF
jgi:hypothetical protein